MEISGSSHIKKLIPDWIFPAYSVEEFIFEESIFATRIYNGLHASILETELASETPEVLFVELAILDEQYMDLECQILEGPESSLLQDAIKSVTMEFMTEVKKT